MLIMALVQQMQWHRKLQHQPHHCCTHSTRADKPAGECQWRLITAAMQQAEWQKHCAAKQQWLLRSLFTSKVSQQSNGHDCLAEAHFICQNAIQAARVDCHEPVQTNVLVLSQSMLQQEWHLQCTTAPTFDKTSCSHMLEMATQKTGNTHTKLPWMPQRQCKCVFGSAYNSVQV